MHFAHKHLANCDYADESPTLRNARAALYEWLISKFGDRVTLEKKIEGHELFRPIDCWVEQESQVFAYWIFDEALKPEKREAIKKYFAKSTARVTWVFASAMLRKDQTEADQIILTITNDTKCHCRPRDALSVPPGPPSANFCATQSTTSPCLITPRRPTVPCITWTRRTGN